MIEIAEEKNYWCIVSLIHYNLGGPSQSHSEVFILHQSNDSAKDDVFNCEIDASEAGLDVSWIEGNPSGVYRLMFEATFDRDDDEEEPYINGAKVLEAVLCYEFPASDEEF